jgi:hypothetical protein
MTGNQKWLQFKSLTQTVSDMPIASGQLPEKVSCESDFGPYVLCLHVFWLVIVCC